MAEGKSTTQSLREMIFGPPTRASLFHYLDETPKQSIWADMDWDLFIHPIRTLKEDRKARHTQASLFHYLGDGSRQHVSFKQLFKDIIASFGGPLFFPSVFANQEELLVDRAQLRRRRVDSMFMSIGAHCLFLLIAVFLIRRSVETVNPQDVVEVVTNPVYLPFGGDGRDGGGGGGGGKGEQAPPATGRMPDTSRVQMVAPDPKDPQPLVPAQDLLAQNATVVMPIDIPQDQALPIGDIGPPNGSRSSGSGSGGGIGTGTGTGVGSGKGPGYGPGEGGGMGGGRGGGIGSGVGPYVAGNGVSAPIPIEQPLPAYTEEARKARAEGIVMIQVVVRKNGTVDNFKVIRGLGYGLDESAITTIATKWRFKPGTLNGIPVDVQANIEVAFHLY